MLVEVWLRHQFFKWSIFENDSILTNLQLVDFILFYPTSTHPPLSMAKMATPKVAYKTDRMPSR